MNSDTFTDPEHHESLREWAKMSAQIGSGVLSMLYDEPTVGSTETRHVLVSREPDDDGVRFSFDHMLAVPSDREMVVIPEGWRGRLIRRLARPPKPPKPVQERPYQARRDPEDVW